MMLSPGRCGDFAGPRRPVNVGTIGLPTNLDIGEATMKARVAWVMSWVVVLGLLAGCNEKPQEPVAVAPPQEPAKFPEETVPPLEPQPAPVTVAPAPAPIPAPAPVDTSVREEPTQAPIVKKAQPAAKPKAAKKPAGRTYVVKSGDTLQKISMKHYKTTKNWRRIYNANKSVLKNPDQLTPGTKLVIP